MTSHSHALHELWSSMGCSCGIPCARSPIQGEWWSSTEMDLGICLMAMMAMMAIPAIPIPSYDIVIHTPPGDMCCAEGSFPLRSPPWKQVRYIYRLHMLTGVKCSRTWAHLHTCCSCKRSTPCKKNTHTHIPNHIFGIIFIRRYAREICGIDLTQVPNSHCLVDL